MGVGAGGGGRAQLLTALSQGQNFVLQIKFLREQNESDWVVEDVRPSLRMEEKGAGHGGDLLSH